MKRKKILFFFVVISLICIIFFVYKNYEMSINTKDITISAQLYLDNTQDNQYILDINAIKQKKCHVIIYPYIRGAGNITFSENETDDFYIPNSLGNDGITLPIAIEELKKYFPPDNGIQEPLAGFWFPDEEGSYKTRLYLNIDDNNKIEDNAYLVCVFTEQKLWKKVTWSKMIPITIK